MTIAGASQSSGLSASPTHNVDTGEDYWISGPKRNGGDALYGGSTPIEIDDDIREEYWRAIRRQPDRVNKGVA